MTDRPLSAEKRGFYRWFINTIASALLVLLWWGLAWLCTKWPGSATQEHYFVMIVAVTVALHLPATRGDR